MFEFIDFHKTRALVENGKFSEAIPIFCRLIAKNPTDFRYLFLRGICYERTGQYNKALSDLYLAADLRPNEIEVLETLAGIHAANNDLQAAQSLYEKAIAQGTTRFHTFQLYGFLLMDLKDYPKAIKYLTKALELESTDIEHFTTKLQLEQVEKYIVEEKIREDVLVAYKENVALGELPKPNVRYEELKITAFALNDQDGCILRVPVSKQLICSYRATRPHKNNIWTFVELLDD